MAYDSVSPYLFFNFKMEEEVLCYYVYISFFIYVNRILHHPFGRSNLVSLTSSNGLMVGSQGNLSEYKCNTFPHAKIYTSITKMF